MVRQGDNDALDIVPSHVLHNFKRRRFVAVHTSLPTTKEEFVIAVGSIIEILKTMWLPHFCSSIESVQYTEAIDGANECP